MEILQLLDRRRRDQRRIAGEHNHQIVGRQSFARDHQRVAGSALLTLQHKPYAGIFHRFAHPIGFMANDGKDVLRRHHLAGGGDNVP